MLPTLGCLIRDSENIFESSHREPLAKLVEGFVAILNLANDGERSDAPKLAVMTNEWVKLFLSLGQLGLKGFETSDITPYIHWMHVHVPYSLLLFGKLKRFNGELLEGKNDDVTKTHARRTNCKDIRLTLQFEKRRELQQMMEEVEKSNLPPPKPKDKPKHDWSVLSRLIFVSAICIGRPKKYSIFL